MLRFRVLGASFSRFWGLRFRDRVLRFRDLGASFSRFGCFVFEFWVLRSSSSFSSASFSKLPVRQASCVETSAAEKSSHVFQTSLHCTAQVVQRKGLRESVLCMT